MLGLLADALEAPARGPSEERVRALRDQAQRQAQANPVTLRPSSRRRSRRRFPIGPLAGVAVGAAAAVALVLGIGALDEDPPVVPTEAVAVSASLAGIEADGELIAHTWGTEIILVVDGLEAGGEYVAAFESTSGERIDAGTFLGIGDGPLRCRLNAALLRNEAVGFTVTDLDGTVVLRSDFAV